MARLPSKILVFSTLCFIAPFLLQQSPQQANAQCQKVDCRNIQMVIYDPTVSQPNTFWLNNTMQNQAFRFIFTWNANQGPGLTMDNNTSYSIHAHNLTPQKDCGAGNYNSEGVPAEKDAGTATGETTFKKVCGQS